MPLKILIRGGGDLATGVAYRLVKAGWQVLITELPQPMAVRRLVSFSQAVYDREITVEGMTARLAETAAQTTAILRAGEVAVMVDPEAKIRFDLSPQVIVDGRMTKQPPELGLQAAPLMIGLGPGFTAGVDCHAVIETMRGAFLGRVFWEGSAEPDTGQPDPVANRKSDRVLRAPCDGTIETDVRLGDILEPGQVIARVSGRAVTAGFGGLLRGLIQPGTWVQAGVKIGDIDPRLDPRLVDHISDKALAVGGGVLEAILSRPDLRPRLWD